jgi:hypothetical protein
MNDSIFSQDNSKQFNEIKEIEYGIANNCEKEYIILDK